MATGEKGAQCHLHKITFKATDVSSGLTLNLTQDTAVPAGSLNVCLNLLRHLHNIKVLHVLTLHVCCTLSIVGFLFI